MASWGTNAYLLDPAFHLFTESQEWLRLRNSFRDEAYHQGLRERALRNFEAFREASLGKEQAFLFVTGPSLETAMGREYPDSSLRIICNSMVKNRPLLRHIRPDLIAFTDDVFHFGPSLYAAEFRHHFAATMTEFPNCYACIPDYAHDLMLAHYPHLADRLIGIPLTAGEWNAPSAAAFHVRSTENILTVFMVPIAVSACEELQIIGADGRRPDENYFWKHSEANQFTDLMWSVRNTHPSFFRDNDYAAYYGRHCDDLSAQVAWAESLGRRVVALTPSGIPALSIRHVHSLPAAPRKLAR